MTNDQKLLFLINATDELLKALDKAEQSGATLHKEDARKKRQALKIWLASNKLVTTAATPVARKKPAFNRNNYSQQNWLAQ